jgi:type II secretory pathway pseudopilin PulG
MRECAGGEAGFSLVEVLIAAAMLSMAVVALAELFGMAAISNRRARDTTYAALLASQKMEQLRALEYGFDQAGAAVTDITSDTSLVPAGADGGTGLSASPSDTLEHNTPGFADYLDASGASLGGGAGIPAGTVYLRRWSITPAGPDPANLLILQVRVFPLGGHRGTDGSAGRMPGEARMLVVRARRAS